MGDPLERFGRIPVGVREQKPPLWMPANSGLSCSRTLTEEVVMRTMLKKAKLKRPISDSILWHTSTYAETRMLKTAGIMSKMKQMNMAIMEELARDT